MGDRSGGEVRKTVTVLFCDVTGSTDTVRRTAEAGLAALEGRRADAVAGWISRSAPST